jgi:LPXTG-site transpeptidase (sortase) family protein
MRRAIPTLLFTVMLSALLVVATALPAFGYIKQTNIHVFPSAPRVAKCNQSMTITAKVKDLKSGKAVWGQVVNFRLIGKQSSGDRLSARKATTNRSGVTSVRLSFGPKAGPRKISVWIPNSKPVITVRCAGGLPKTSVLPPDGFEEQAPSAFLETPVEPPPAVASMVALPATSVRMRRLGIDLPLVEGDGYRVPDDALAHYPGSAWPGDGSNMYVYGHAREGHLLELWRVRTGDLVEVGMADGTTIGYEVSEIHPLVDWDALGYVNATDREIITLQTCLSYEDAAPRFVVIAERIPSA